ncbi:DUF6206 family protein [Blastococcus sp. SYSU D00695]
MTRPEGSVRPDELIGLPALDEVEAVVRRAIDERRNDLVDVVGNGEFSLAMRWAVPGGQIVVKRIPPFFTVEGAEQYRRVTREYIAVIEASGVACLKTEVVQYERPEGGAVVYHCQPLLSPDQLVSNVLRSATPSADHPVVTAVVEAVGKVVRPHVAFDAQVSNWAWHEGQVWYLDLSTPFLLDESDDLQFPFDGFELEYPWFVRPVLARETKKWLPHYTELEFVLYDLVALLHREGLQAWCRPFAEVIARLHGIDIDLERAAKNFASDARFYPVTHALRKLQRFWLQRTGRRYESLLTPTSSYAADRRS